MNLQKRFETVAVVGEPNVGKSTLVNALVGQKVSIISPKAQTTRYNLLGLFVEGDTQIALTDTPGIFAPRERLGRAMVNAVRTAMHNAARVLWVIDASHPRISRSIDLLQKIPNVQAAIVFNKIDRVAKPKLLELAYYLNEQYPFEATFMVSALKQDGIQKIKHFLAESAPSGEWLYPEDQVTNLPLRLFAAELTRERLYKRLHQEIPYACIVETEQWEDFTFKNETRIVQNIYIQKDSQRPILLGKGGEQIHEIRASVQKELSAVMERKVHLFLYVKVHENWPEDKAFYDLWGLRYNV
ncbi:MAG: GTPase Era [Holosporales bacterium]|jgi:GTP-binding protein Era|nr:GTPase Era [Holosporales bacterium]